MSERPIHVGDAVYVYRTCCTGTEVELYGKVGIVRAFSPYKYKCYYCGWSGTEARAIAFSEPDICAPISWLKRIDPGCLDEDIPEKEELTV